MHVAIIAAAVILTALGWIVALVLWATGWREAPHWAWWVVGVTLGAVLAAEAVAIVWLDHH